MKRITTFLLICLAACASAQKTPLKLENGWIKCFIPNQAIHTYHFNYEWASVHCPTWSDSNKYPKVRLEFAEPKPANLGLVYDFVTEDTIKTSYMVRVESKDNKTFIVYFNPAHKNIAGVSLFGYKPRVGTVKLKKACLLSVDGKEEIELKPIVNNYGGCGIVTEDIENPYNGTIVYEERWQSIGLTGVEGRKGAKITIKSKKGFGKDIQVNLAYDVNGEEVIDYYPIEDSQTKVFSVRSRADRKLKSAVIQIKAIPTPRRFIEIEEAYIE